MKQRNCVNCNREFNAKRSDNKYCEPACRVKAHAKRNPEAVKAKNNEYVRRWRDKKRAKQLEALDVVVQEAVVKEETSQN